MSECSVDGCTRPVVARSWCQAHYTRWRRHGDPLADQPVQAGEVKSCSVDGCVRPAFTRGYCGPHYKQWLRHGQIPAPRDPRPDRCRVEGCDAPVDARDLCHGHYQRVRRTGRLVPETPLRGVRGTCSVVGCGRPHAGHGLCTTHLWRVRNHGDVLAEVPVRKAPGDGWLNHGYWNLSVPPELRHLTNGDTKIGEHRLVMAIVLGRPLKRHEHVHHINGDRLDNRPENLELWTTWQPKGQRVRDQVEWAARILRTYGGPNSNHEPCDTEVAPMGFEPTPPP